MNQKQREQQTKEVQRGQTGPASNEYAKQRARELAQGRKYGLRTEFRRDCTLIMATLSPWLLTWREAAGIPGALDESHVGADGRVWNSQNWSGDTDVEFVISADGPALNEIQWLISAIVDCHVAAETVAPLETYSGERLHFDELSEVAAPPRHDLLKEAMKSLRSAQQTYATFAEFHEETIEKCRAAMGDEEPYKRRVAKRSARGLVQCVGGPPLDVKTLEEVLYANISFDKAGAHINLPGL